MKAWLLKFRISAALDAGKPLPPPLVRSIENSEDLRRFTQQTTALERALVEAKPALESPPSLHQAILRSVEAAGRPESPRFTLSALRWLPVPALAVLLAFALWPASNPPKPALDPSSLAALSETFDAGNNMTRTLAPALVAPLSDELNRLNRDLDATAQFLLACVP